MLVIDADAHINEPVVRLDAPDDELAPWRVLAERHPGWQQAGKSGGRTVSLIEGKLFPTQEGPGRGVPIESAMHPLAADGALHLDARTAPTSGWRAAPTPTLPGIEGSRS